YGIYSHKIKSVIISHQMQVKMPVARYLEPVIQKWLYGRHKKFSSVWIPDIKGEPNLSGDLGHTNNLHPDTKYLGILTRFEDKKEIIATKNQVLVILSGPEPQRSMLEEILLNQAAALPYHFIIVQGKSEKKETIQLHDNVQLITFCRADELNILILQAEIIIARGGYSTLMDLALFGKKCIFIPTPGQTEQEYLVHTLKEKKLCIQAKQQAIQLNTLLQLAISSNYRFYIPAEKELFKKIIAAEIT
ncbi:MAG: glycosyltransferase, partial [Chitinophagales bacterium]